MVECLRVFHYVGFFRLRRRETQKLAAWAQATEDCAGIAIEIAQASIDDAERMVLEAIAARRDAEAVTVGCPNRRRSRR